MPACLIVSLLLRPVNVSCPCPAHVSHAGSTAHGRSSKSTLSRQVLFAELVTVVLSHQHPATTAHHRLGSHTGTKHPLFTSFPAQRLIAAFRPRQVVLETIASSLQVSDEVPCFRAHRCCLLLGYRRCIVLRRVASDLSLSAAGLHARPDLSSRDWRGLIYGRYLRRQAGGTLSRAVCQYCHWRRHVDIVDIVDMVDTAVGDGIVQIVVQLFLRADTDRSPTQSLLSFSISVDLGRRVLPWTLSCGYALCHRPGCPSHRVLRASTDDDRFMGGIFASDLAQR
jgi:hypothetical protein